MQGPSDKKSAAGNPGVLEKLHHAFLRFCQRNSLCGSVRKSYEFLIDEEITWTQSQ